jgi:hypothetical protein
MANNEKYEELSKKENSEISMPILQEKQEKNQYIFETNKWRVKLYHLNENGQWDDFGIGYVFCAWDEKTINNSNKIKDKQLNLIMIKEESDEEMFNIDISKKSIEFHNQRGIIITWKTGSENNEEDNKAISFQEKEGIIEIWNTILINQGKNPHDKNNALISDNQPETFLEVSLQNLPNLLRELSTDMDELKINNLISFLKTSKFEFIKKLGELLKEEEKKEEIKSLISTETNYTALPINSNRKKNNKLEKGADYNNHLTSIEKQIYKSTCMENIIYIYTIIKNLITLGNKDLIELLFNDECYLISFGALEYDLDVSEIVPHRKYFKEIVKFKNPLNIDDEEILQKINLNLRLAYLRDTVFARNIEVNTIKAINFMIQINNNDIIKFFIDEEKYLDLLCKQLQDNNLLVQKDAFQLFYELINCSKDIYQTKVIFNETLFEMGILHILTQDLEKISSNDNKYFLDNISKKESLLIKEKIINIIIEIIINFLSTLPNEFNLHLKCSNLLLQLTNLMLNNDNFGIKYEISNIFKMMIEFNAKDEAFSIDAFYTQSFVAFLEYLLKPVEQNKKTEMSITKQIIIEIFIYLFSLNVFEPQFWLKENKLEEIISKLLEDNNKIINLYTIKILKCIIDYTDMSVCKIIFTKEICDKLIQLFKDNIKNSNIIISCIYDFFDALNNKKDELFYLIINQEKEFFYESEYKIFFKKISARIENKPKEEKHLMNYITFNYYKDLDLKMPSDIKENEEKQLNNFDSELFYNNINNMNDIKLNEESKLLEKKRKRYFGIDNYYDDAGYYSDDLNEYEENENFNKKKRKNSFTIFDEDEADFEKIYKNIINNENKINSKENEEINSDKYIK